MSEKFVVSARKFRPDSFESLLGQEAVSETLRRAILQQKTAHAYLFCGPRGVGKTSAARIFARAINCASPLASGEACGECDSCRAFAEQRSFNVFEMDAASNNSANDIRQLIEEVNIPPQVGRYKIYIIDEVHMLSTAAFNAFLKTLEEPPEYVVFIMASTEKQKILPTNLSGCQLFDIKP
ncbi:DNA polymerase III subunit gamma/tau, partial [Porphyromonas endodontalis]|uniref:DNA polymerase III subunit gamma/tau n=1 Tax=Porphyromonas endodontalis TaxID=28124 RepID=UPI003C7E1F46